MIYFTSERAAMIYMLFMLPFLISCRTVKFYDKGSFQSIPKEKYSGKLSPILNETSGLEYYNGKLWTFNDSGGEAEIYSFPPDNFVELESYTIADAENIDWEDITQDQNYIYIADVGNNMGIRDTFTIYRIKKTLSGENQMIDSEKIRFLYPEKDILSDNHIDIFYDCEAVISIQDSIWLFTKNRKNKKSLIYKVPAKPGFHAAKLTNQLDPDILVTGSYYDPADSLLYLLGNERFIPSLVIYKISGDNKIEKQARITYWNRAGLQTEGIVGDFQDMLYFSFERSRKKQGLMIMSKPN